MIILGKWLLRLLETGILFALANSYSLGKFTEINRYLPLLLLAFLLISVFPSAFNFRLQSRRLHICGDGCELLLLFLSSTSLSVFYTLQGYLGKYPLNGVKEEPKLWIIHTLLVILVEALVFWNGIIRIYLTSIQLGVRYRILGILCGWIPLIHLIVLGRLLQIVSEEVAFENDKLLLNQERASQEICKTKYPILMIHGVFFRDFRYFNYWGRIPGELEKNGATIFYGNHQSASSVEDSGEELARRIEEIIKETGAEKLNIIAHSKGGLDCRYAISMLGADKYVATLTTINTPHRGCEFADYLLSKIPQKQKEVIATTYNTALKQLGDPKPDFLAAVGDLCASKCLERNETVKDKDTIYYQSVGSKCARSTGGRFPLNFSYKLVRHFDGANDGLVGESSFSWGSSFQFLTVKGKRGISHGDMIDLNRENFKDFDVREFYVQLVHALKEKGF